MELKKYKLSDVATVEISNVDKKSKEGEAVVRLCNFTDDYYNWAVTNEMVTTFMEASASDKQIERFSLKKGQVALTKDSETRYDIGIPTYIADDFDNVILGYHCALITPDESKISGKYLNAFMNSPFINKYFANSASGSGQRYALSVEVLESMPLLLPSLEEQIRIGDFFSKLDRKIALNRAINKNLEALAKQIYDYWFLQFDFPDENGRPYKSSGGIMVWNEKLKREIPFGWEKELLSAFLTIRNGRDHKHLSDGVYPVYGSGGEMRRVSEFLFNGESVLMPRKGSLNNIMYVNKSFWTVDTMFYSEMKIPNCAKYIFFSIKDIDFTRWDSGTGVPSMTASTLYAIPIVKPKDNILKKFDIVTTPLFQKIEQLKKENEELFKQRNELLPLLMNGQVTIE